jgi:hypothetical protein
MSSPHDSFLAALTSLSKEQINQAGQRYTPGIDSKAPNLRIDALITAIENVACGTGALARFAGVLDTFSMHWDSAKNCSQRRGAIQALTDQALTFLPAALDRLRARDARAADEWSETLGHIESELEADMNHWRGEDAKLPPTTEDGGYSSERNVIRSNMNSIGTCLRVVRDEIGFAQSAAFKVLFEPLLLIRGEWGTGKTHLLCDVTQIRISQGQATVLVLAKNFEGRVVAEICGRIEAGRGEDEFFDQLQALADEQGSRAVVIVDGVNEGRRREWREAVSTLQSLVASRPGVGLIVTCRTPFESIAIEQNDLNKFHKVTHLGFDDQEFDAQAAFFDYYRLPLPEVPLLDREFSRPLTLKLICQSLQDLSEKKLAKGFAGIASGQKGMTFVLERFVQRLGQPIEGEFGLNAKGCWLLLKGTDQIADRRLAGFAPCMAVNLRGYVRPAEADRIIAANYPALRPAERRRLLEALRTSGLIEEDAIWYSSRVGLKSRVVYRLPYQRFSDHLVARHLLTTYLDASSAITIRRSFSTKSPLGRIFRIASRYQREFTEPGWAQALITEFPERVGTRLPSKERELFFVLPKRAQSLNAYFHPFIEGMFWRNPEAFTEGTRVVINSYLKAGGQARERVFDALAAVSTKPKHPYHARRLYNFLATFPMPERDLQWSEYLRRRHSSPTIHRLLTWAQKLRAANMTPQSAKELVILLSLVLTTVNRNDRDIATKALVLIGERFPDVLFRHLETSLAFNDPYLPERMLAAAYGTTLSLVDSECAATFRPVLGPLATTLYLKMFAPGAKYATHHTLMRDYALGIIEMAQRAKCVELPNSASRNLAAPYPNTLSTFTSNGTPDTKVEGAIGRAIQIDFGNYTIGRLIPQRSNYDDKHPGYLQVRAKIERRMFDLGYREEHFRDSDREIGNTSFHARVQDKVDRYGKKYSWIAYFEMWGEREAARKLPDWRLGERTSDCGVDPSFPKPPPQWTPPIPDMFGASGGATGAWVGGGFTPDWGPLLVVSEINGYPGEWILVEGFLRGVDTSNDRDIFAFLRGLFVARKDVTALRSKFLAIEYPGNDAIPSGATETYLYAGEAGRRQNYVQRLRQRDGTYRRQTAEAFVGYKRVRTKLKRPVRNLTIKLDSEDGADSERSLVHLLDPSYEMRRVPGIRVELPSVQFGWESYHSTQNELSGFAFPAPRLIQRLGLASRNREIDFYDSAGIPGSLYREAGDGWRGNQHKLLYVRADLLRRYLTDTRQALVWCNWGERGWLNKMDGPDVIRTQERQRIWEVHGHIHRSFSEWSTKNPTIK